jgi:hypothetical protein
MGVLALVLLLNQTLGLLHGIVHGPLIATGHAAHVGQVADVVAQADHDADNFFSRLFSGHEEDSACRLYDQSSHLDAVPGVPVLALPLVLQPFVFSVLSGLAVARWHALFQARGPPSVR